MSLQSVPNCKHYRIKLAQDRAGCLALIDRSAHKIAAVKIASMAITHALLPATKEAMVKDCMRPLEEVISSDVVMAPVAHYFMAHLYIRWKNPTSRYGL